MRSGTGKESRANRMNSTYRIEPLDLIQTVFMEQHAPFMYCYLWCDMNFDICRLEKAVAQTVCHVPQLLMRYCESKKKWAATNIQANEVIITNPDDGVNVAQWDLRNGPQIRILIFQCSSGYHLQICMSHILTDAKGFLQWLHLLCRYYAKPLMTLYPLQIYVGFLYCHWQINN